MHYYNSYLLFTKSCILVKIDDGWGGSYVLFKDGGCGSHTLLDGGGVGSQVDGGDGSLGGRGGEGPLFLVESFVLFDVELGEDILLELALAPMEWCTLCSCGSEGNRAV